MKKLIYSRRGVAIELAIGVMFVMMALGIILVTNASLQNRQMNSDLADYEEKVEMYEITDWIIEGTTIPEEYTITPTTTSVDEVEYTIYKVTKNDVEILTFTVRNSDKTITSWN